MAEDITIRIPPDQAQADAAKINQSVESIERSAVKAGAALGTEISKGTQQAVNVVHSSTNTINRAMDSITAKIRATGVSAPTPLQQVEALRMQGIGRTSGDARAYEQINAAAAAQTRILQENAAAQLKASAAAEQHNRTMRASDEQWSRFRVNAMGAKQALDNLRTSEERATTSNARYMQQQALVGRTPVERRDIQRQQEYTSALAGAGTDPAARARLIASYGAANTRLKEQDILQKQAALSAKGLSGELGNAVERLGAAFVAWKLWNLAVTDGIIGTAMAAARTETLGVAMEAAAQSNNLSTFALVEQEKAVKKLGITTEDARQALTRMMVVELDTSKATELARLAQDAAVISNMNSSDAFQQMIYGIQSGQVRVLRTIGINVQFAESYQRLARALGVNVLDLSEQEKAQARLNEVLRVAPQYAGIYEASMGSIGKQMTSLKRYFKEAQDAIGKEFIPALGIAVRSLTELAKFGEMHPQAGSILALLGGGAAVGVGAYFMMGPKAGAAVGIITAVLASISAIDKLSMEFARVMNDVVVHLNDIALAILNLKGVGGLVSAGAGAVVGSAVGAASSPSFFRDELFKFMGSTIHVATDQAYRQGLLLDQNLSDRTKLLQMSIERTTKGMEDSHGRPNSFAFTSPKERTPGMSLEVPMGSAAATMLADAEKMLAPVFRKWYEGFDRKSAAERQLSTGKTALDEAVSKKSEAGVLAATQEINNAQRILDLIKEQEAAEKLLASARETNAIKEHESMRESYKLLEEIGKLHMNNATLNQLYGELNNTIVRESNKDLGVQKDAYDKIVLKMQEMNSELVKMDKINGVVDTSAVSKKMMDDITQAGASNRKVDRDLAYADLQRQSEMELKLNEGAEGATVRSIETTYQKRLQMAQDYWDYENTKVLEIDDLKERLAAGEKLYKEKYNMVGDAAMERVTGLIKLQQEHFRDLQRSFEGLFDAAFEGAKSFTNALKRMMMAVFLTPIKEQMSRMFAGMFMGMQGMGGGGGGTSTGGGILNRIFNTGGASNTTNRVSETLNVNMTGGGGGINSVRLINGAVPVVIVGTASAGAGGSGGSGGGGGTTTMVGAGAGFLGGLLSRAPRTIGGEVIGAGGSTAGMARDASGLWLRGAGGTGDSALAGGAALGMAGLPTYSGGGFGGVGLPGMMPGWAGSTGIAAGGGGGVGGIGGMLKSMNWANLAGGVSTMAGMGLLSNGLQKKSALQTIVGGGLLGGGIGLMGGPVGALGGVGFGLGAAGLMRGGWSGVGMTTAGGAMIGAQIGTTIFPGLGTAVGAGIGALVGFGTGMVRMLFKTAAEKAHDKIKTLYSVNITTKSILEQIVATAKSSYGGNLDMAIRTPQVRDLIELYAMSTGQPMGGAISALSVSGYVTHGPMTSTSLMQSGGSIYQQQAYSNYGNAISVRSAFPVAGGGVSAAAPIVIPLNIDGKTVGTAIIQDGRVVTQGAINSIKGNSGRRELTALQMSPGLVTS